MEIAVTGGGTGGHIYPALEVANLLTAQGHRITYLGSDRGQEGEMCKARGYEFHAFGSAPLYSLKQLRGWRSLFKLLAASAKAKGYLARRRPSVIFSTGGYSAAPIMQAARSLRIPYLIHEANSVPGRSNRMFAESAFGFTCVFETTQKYVSKAVRTGQPIRAELREAAKQSLSTEKDLIFCIGGSQGSVFLNGVFPDAVSRLKSPIFSLLATGRSNYSSLDMTRLPVTLEVEPYLETAQMVAAYRRSKIVVARSGGTVAELAMFGIPSVLIPLPTSADDHQTKNAEEIVKIGGAKLLPQSNASPENLAQALEGWLNDQSAYEQARSALREWDQPLATAKIAELVVQGANRDA